MLANLTGFSQFERMSSKAKPSRSDSTEKQPEPREIASMSKLLTAIAINEFKIRRGGKKLLADGVLVQVFAVR